MLGFGLPGLDLSPLLQFVFTALAVVATTLLLVKKAASCYFVVDASFEADGEGMSIGGGGDGEGNGNGSAAVPRACAMCGGSTAKKCSRCKSVWYCSQACQSKHWEADHKLKCKQIRSSDNVAIDSSENSASRRRKSSGYNSISLVPARGTCKVLQEPKKILFPYDEFVKLFNWDKPRFPPCGLLNCGNSCFANVVLQCLASTQPLVAYLLEKDHNRGCIRKLEDWCFLCELQAHIKRASQSSQPFSPLNILSRLPNIGGNLGYGKQEDAHEFMRFAIDTMQSVCLDEYGGEKALDLSTQETTLIQHIFGGHLQSQVICTKCNMISNRYENMMDLTVEIHGDAESLEECLDQFTVKEWLDGENMYKCDGCNDYVKAWKRLTVHQAPNILTIALKRFQSGRFGKLNKRVAFPEDLDLTPYMSGNGDGSDLYTLYAVVVHLDMLNASFFGHYICYTKDYDGRWYKIDDCKVMNVEVEEVLSQGAYMLLYRRRTPRREPFIKPLEPVRKKHLLANGDPEPSNIPKEASPASILACLPSDSGLQSNLTLHEAPIDVSLLRDTGHERQYKMKNYSAKGKETEYVNSEAPIEVNLMHVPKDLQDVDMDDPNPSSSGPKDLEEGTSSLSSQVPEKSSLPSTEVEAMACEGSSGSSDTDFLVKDDQSISIMEEASKPSGYTSEESFSNNIVGNMPVASSASSTSSGAAPGASDGLLLKFKPIMAAHVPVDSAIGVNRLGEGIKASASCSENGSRGKTKPLFSRGFLDMPPRNKPAEHERRTPTVNSVVSLAPKINGYYSNGHSGLHLAEESGHANAASLQFLSENGGDAHNSSNTSGMIPAFPSKSHMNLVEEYKSVYRSAEPASVSQSEVKDCGPKANCSSGKTSMETNGIVCTQENGRSAYEKDSSFRLGLENNNNGGSAYQINPLSGRLGGRQ